MQGHGALTACACDAASRCFGVIAACQPRLKLLMHVAVVYTYAVLLHACDSICTAPMFAVCDFAINGM